MAITVTRVTVPISPSSVPLPVVPSGAAMTVSLTATQDLFNTVQAYGAATAPTAGATIATFGTLTPGSYEISVWTHVWGTGASSVENNNMQLTGMPGSPLTLIVDGGTGTTPLLQQFSFVTTTTRTPAVTAVTAASANTVYSACIKATTFSSDVYLGTQASFTPGTNGMPLGKPGSVTITNPVGAAAIQLYASSLLRTHTISATVVTPK